LHACSVSGRTKLFWVENFILVLDLRLNWENISCVVDKSWWNETRSQLLLAPCYRCVNLGAIVLVPELVP
jgi:hypothetical protein